MPAPSGTVNIRGKEYKTVALRLSEFRAEYPPASGWGVVSELVECNADQVVVRSAIINPEGRTIATGLAQETWGGQINSTSAVENCETSAVGRALAAAGYGGSEFASADEVERAIGQQKAGKTNKPASRKRASDRKSRAGTSIPDFKSAADLDEVISQLDAETMLPFVNKVFSDPRVKESPTLRHDICDVIAARARVALRVGTDARKEVSRILKEQRATA